jgi:phosphoglycerol transferase MdoB-like AlkP superfamily enzyme
MFSPVLDPAPHEMLMLFGASGLLAAAEKSVWERQPPGKPWLTVYYALAVIFLLVTARWFFAINDRVFI